MPELTPLAAIPIPLWDEADQVPPDLKAAFIAAEQGLVLRAINQADRDARYSDVPEGTIVSGTDQDAIWRKNATGWQTIWSDTGVVSSGIVSSDANNSSMQSQRGRIRGGQVSWAITMRYTGPDVTAGSNGNIGNFDIGTVATAWQPPWNWFGVARFASTFGSLTIAATTGVMTIAEILPNSSLLNGNQIWISCSYAER